MNLLTTENRAQSAFYVGIRGSITPFVFLIKKDNLKIIIPANRDHVQHPLVWNLYISKHIISLSNNGGENHETYGENSKVIQYRTCSYSLMERIVDFTVRNGNIVLHIIGKLEVLLVTV